VGKAPGDAVMTQDEINGLLVARGAAGREVVRLKGGDPFVFGRGGEEVEALAAAGVAFEVVPGITAACGVAAYAGIPLTHRDYANSCLFVAGHLKDGSVDLDWDSLARPGRTLVVYMGLVGLPTLCRELVAHGLSDATPAAIVQHGTTPSQRTVVGTLATLPQLAQAARLAPPTLIIVGEVVRLQSQLAWYEAPAAGGSVDARALDRAQSLTR
jgi:uroporphyrin-III C-methyltransferase / precorrin-2 dehydrogenase / sirohydrochlorin ferrochelatase